MCTLTWFVQPGGYQLFFNRDELRTRKGAFPPTPGRAGDVRFLAPRDGDHGGTWICVNDRGLTLCLLNGYAGYDPPPPDEGFATRGELPISLIDGFTLDVIDESLRARNLSRYRSFVLAGFCADGESARWEWREGQLRRMPAVDRQSPLVSSSFESREVRRQRMELFANMRAARPGQTASFHLAYHESHAPARGPYSPCMHRDDGQTVSLSWIEVDSERVGIRYGASPPCRGRPQGPPLCLPRRRG